MDGKPFNGMGLLYGTADPDTVIGTTSDEPGDLQELWNKQDWNQKK